MLDRCANPECARPFDYTQGRFFRFRLSCAGNETPANVHCVQHFWLCGLCAETQTLQDQGERGVILSPRPLIRPDRALPRRIRAA